jgi:hypothetical protein
LFQYIVKVLNSLHSQESLCDPIGNECYETMKEVPEKCQIPCNGVYADVVKKAKTTNVVELRKFDKLVVSYEQYKRGSKKDIKYSKEIFGKLIRKISVKYLILLFRIREEI